MNKFKKTDKLGSQFIYLIVLQVDFNCIGIFEITEPMINRRSLNENRRNVFHVRMSKAVLCRGIIAFTLHVHFPVHECSSFTFVYQMCICKKLFFAFKFILLPTHFYYFELVSRIYKIITLLYQSDNIIFFFCVD